MVLVRRRRRRGKGVVFDIRLRRLRRRRRRCRYSDSDGRRAAHNRSGNTKKNTVRFHFPSSDQGYQYEAGTLAGLFPRGKRLESRLWRGKRATRRWKVGRTMDEVLETGDKDK